MLYEVITAIWSDLDMRLTHLNVSLIIRAQQIEDYPVTPWRDRNPVSGGIPRKEY